MKDASLTARTFGMATVLGLALTVLPSSGLVTFLAAATLVVLAGLFLLTHRRIPEAAAIVLLFTAFLLDAPWGRAFYEYTPLTESLGTLLFANMHTSIGLPGVSVSLFEALSFALAIGLAIKETGRNRSPSPSAKTAIVVALVLPAIAVFGVVQGVLRGNDLGAALTQTRALAILPVWFFIGWILGRTPRPAMTALWALTSALLVKSLQGLYVYWRLWGRSMGDHEFLVEHMTSDYILTACFFCGGLWLWYLKGLKQRLLVLTLLMPMGVVFLLNNRRSAFIGLAISLAFAALAMPRGWLMRHSPKVAALAFAGILFVAATWNTQGPLGFASHSIKSIVVADKESSRDYRTAENSNLYAGLSQNILLGMGFGTRFALTYKMDNIARIYENFNLIPHNTLLYLWAFVGPLGIAGFAMFIVMNMALATRVMRTGLFDHRWILAFTALTMIIRWAVFVYSDIGLLEVRSLTILGFILGSLWRLAPDVVHPHGQGGLLS